MRMFRHRIGRAATLVLVAVLAMGAYVRGTAKTSTVVPHTIHAQIVANAEVVPAGGVSKVRARADGRVVSVLVREGQQVTKGQLLAKIEPDLLKSELAAKRAAWQATTQEAESIASGSRDEERQALAADVRASEADAALAEANARRLEALRQTQSIPDAQAEDARHARDLAVARLEAARARLRLAEKGGRATDVAAARRRAEAAAAAHDTAMQSVSWTNIESPVEGTVLSRHIDVGDTVLGASAGMTPVLFEIADVRSLELHLEVGDTDATTLAVGRPVTVTGRGGLRERGRGTIVRVGARMSPRTIGAHDARERAESWVRSAWATIEWSGEPAMIGERVEARLSRPPRDVERAVVRDAVVIRDGEVSVETVWGPWFRPVPVVLGAGDHEMVEVIGVERGTRVRRRP